MAEYIRTDNSNFNVKEELKKAKKIKNTPRHIDNLSVNEYNKVRKEWELSKEGDVVLRVDPNDGREYYWDKKLGREVSKTGQFFGRYGGKSIRDRVEEYWRKKNNLPTKAERQQAIKDIKYLEARIRYEQRDTFRNKEVTKWGYEDGKRKVTKSTVHAENIRKDKEAGRILEDGRTVYEAKWDAETNRFETDMVNSYENSSYYQKDLSSLNTRVQNKAKEETKTIKEKPVVETVSKPSRYMEMQKRQKELDETVNKNPMKSNALKIPPKEVKTYDLRNLLQIEQ